MVYEEIKGGIYLLLPSGSSLEHNHARSAIVRRLHEASF